MLARNDQGLEIYRFDTSVGQWRPQVDANGVPQALRVAATAPSARGASARHCARSAGAPPVTG